MKKADLHRARSKCLAVCRLLLMLLASSALALTAEKAGRQDITFGFPEFPPLSFANEQGNPDGYLVRLSSAMFDRAGLHAHAEIYPAPRLFQNMINGSIDFSMVVHNPALDACCLFSKKAVIRDELRVYHANGKAPLLSQEALIGKHIIIIEGFSYAGLIKFINDERNRIISEVAPSHAAAFAMLDAGRADYVLDYALPATQGLAEHPMEKLRYETIGHLDIYLVLSKRYPDAERLLVRLAEIAENLKKEPAFRLPGQSE
jgi:ABC-type amino acid transport substrate-binding protein